MISFLLWSVVAAQSTTRATTNVVAYATTAPVSDACREPMAACASLKSRGWFWRARPQYGKQYSANYTFASQYEFTPQPTFNYNSNSSYGSGNSSCGESNCYAPVGTVCGNGTWINAVFSGPCTFCYCTNNDPFAYSTSNSYYATTGYWNATESPTTGFWNTTNGFWNATTFDWNYTASTTFWNWNSNATSYYYPATTYAPVTYLPSAAWNATQAVVYSQTCAPIFCYALVCSPGTFLTTPAPDAFGCATGCAYCSNSSYAFVPPTCPPPPQYCAPVYCNSGFYAQAPIDYNGCVVGCPFCTGGSFNYTATFMPGSTLPEAPYCPGKCIARLKLTTNAPITDLAKLNATIFALVKRNVTYFQTAADVIYVDVESGTGEARTVTTYQKLIKGQSFAKSVGVLKQDGALAREDELPVDIDNMSASSALSLSLVLATMSLLAGIVA